MTKTAVPPAPTFEALQPTDAAHRLRMIANDIDRVVIQCRAMDDIDRETLQAAYTAVLTVERHLDDVAAGRAQG